MKVYILLLVFIVLPMAVPLVGGELYYINSATHLAEFNSTRVGMRLYPKHLGTVLSQYWVDIEFTSVEEPNATMRFDDLTTIGPGLKYVQPAPDELNILFKLNSSSANFRLIFQTFNTTQNYSSFGKEFPIPADTIKFSVQVDNDTAFGPTGLRFINVVFTLSDALVNYDNHYDGVYPYIRDIIFLTTYFNVTLAQPLWADADGGREVVVSGTTSGYIVNSVGAVMGVKAFIFSQWNSSWYYDPTLSITLIGYDSTGANGDGGNSDTGILLAIILPSVLVPLALLIVLVVVVVGSVVTWIYRKRVAAAFERKLDKHQSVNF